MGEYRYALSDTVAEAAFGLSTHERRTLADLFRSIAAEPHLAGDFVDQDDTGRPLQVKLYGHWLITWWPDHGASEVRIVDVVRV